MFVLRHFHKILPKRSDVKNGWPVLQKFYSSERTQSDSDKENNNFNSEQDVEKSILLASLQFVPAFGWSDQSLTEGASSIGYSQLIEGLFPNGATDLVNFFYQNCNEKLEEKLKVLSTPSKDGKKKGVSQFIREAIEIRLRMNISYIEHMPQAVALHCSPQNIPQALNNFGTSLDHIWYYAGDRSYDFSWYTKRLTLAGVYKSTELCMIQDTSEDFQDTWKFLDRRLQDVMTFGKITRGVQSVVDDTSKIGKAVFLTGLNIIGINSRSR